MKPSAVMRPRGAATGDPSFSSVVFLSGFEGGSVIDESPLAQTITLHGAAAASAVQAKFGTKSLSRPAAGDYTSVPDNAAFFSGTTHFTVEGWFYWTAKAVSEHGLMGQGDRVSDRGWNLYYDHTGTFLDFEIYDGASFNDAISVTWEPSLNTWYHIAVDFDGTKYRAYINGALLQANTASHSLRNTTSTLTVGGYLSGGSVGSVFAGYIDEVRVTAGVARYATDVGFTAPTAAFPRS